MSQEHEPPRPQGEPPAAGQAGRGAPAGDSRRQLASAMGNRAFARLARAGSAVPRARLLRQPSGAPAARPLVFVELGAGDLRAAIDVARKGGVRVIAVDPVAPSPTAVEELVAAGGSFVRGTAASLRDAIADHVYQYYPWRITGTGSHVTGGTWQLVDDTVRLLKPGGAAHFVTEEHATATFLAEEGSRLGLRVAITETTAGEAAAAATGSGVPGMSSSLRVWQVNVYAPATGGAGGLPAGSAPAALPAPAAPVVGAPPVRARWFSGRSVGRAAGLLAVTLLIEWYFAKKERERIANLFETNVDPEVARRLDDQAKLVEALIDQDPHRHVYANVVLELSTKETKGGVANATVDTTLEDARVLHVGISFEPITERSTVDRNVFDSWLTAQELVRTREHVTYSVPLKPPDLERRQMVHDARATAGAGRLLPPQLTASHESAARDAYIARYIAAIRDDPGLEPQYRAALAHQADLAWKAAIRPKHWWDMSPREPLDLTKLPRWYRDAEAQP